MTNEEREEHLNRIRRVYRLTNACCLPPKEDIVCDVQLLLQEIDRLKNQSSVVSSPIPAEPYPPIYRPGPVRAASARWQCSICGSWVDRGKPCYCGNSQKADS